MTTQVQSYSHNSSAYDSQGHSNDIRRCIVRRWDDYPGFGLHLSRTPNNTGVVVSEVEQGSPASACGLLPGDRVIEINSIEVESKPFVDILQILQNELKFDEVEFLVASASTPADIDYKHAQIAQKETPLRGSRSADKDSTKADAMMIASLVGKTTGEPWENIIDSVSQNYEKLNPRPLADDAIIATSNDLDNEFKEALRAMNKNKEGETLKADPDFERLMVASKRRSYRSTPVVIEKRDGDGIGISVSPDPDIGHIISEVAPGSPAERANIKRGDVIIQIGDDVVLQLPYKKLVSKLQSLNQNRIFLSVAPKDIIMRCALEHVPILTQYDTGKGATSAPIRGTTPYSSKNIPSYQDVPRVPSKPVEQVRPSSQGVPKYPVKEPGTPTRSQQPPPPSYRMSQESTSASKDVERRDDGQAIGPSKFVTPPSPRSPEPDKQSSFHKPETVPKAPLSRSPPAEFIPPTATPIRHPAAEQKIPQIIEPDHRGSRVSLGSTPVTAPSIDNSITKLVKIISPGLEQKPGFDVETISRGHHFVSWVSPILKSSNLLIGDRIMDINGLDATKLTKSQLINEAINILENGILQLIVLSPSFAEKKLPPGARHLVIMKEKSKPVGFQLKTLNQEGRPEKIHAFGDIIPGMAADIAGVREGDRIIRINGEDVDGLSHQEVLSILKRDVPRLEVDVIEDEVVKCSLRDTADAEAAMHKISKPPLTPTEPQQPGLLTFSIDVDPNVPSIGLRLTKDMVIQSVEANGAAARAGLQKNDLVVRINGTPVSSAEHQQAFHALRQAIASGHVDLTVDRRVKSDENIATPAVIATPAQPPPMAVPLPSSAKLPDRTSHPVMHQQGMTRNCVVTGLVAGNPIGISLKDNKDRPAEITRITAGSPADRAGLHIRDLVLKVNGKDVEKAKFSEVKSLISSSVPSGTLQLEVINDDLYPEYKGD